MSTMIACAREGRVTLRVAADVHSDGSCWHGGIPVLDAQAPGGLDRAALVPLVAARDWAAVPAVNYARMGANPSGLVVMPAADYDAEARRVAAAHLREYRASRPGAAERAEIAALLARADRLEYSGSENNVVGPICMRAEAGRRLAAWRTAYPAEALEEQVSHLRSMADRKRELAAGALTHDCDGSLTHEMQQSRHDTWMAEADALEAEAAGLEGA